MMNGTILFARHSLNMMILPTRPLPSWNGWMRSNWQWKLMMSSSVLFLMALYVASRTFIWVRTSSGAVVFIPPTSFGSCLYSPTLNHDFLLSEVPFFRRWCNSLIIDSVSLSFAWSMM